MRKLSCQFLLFLGVACGTVLCLTAPVSAARLLQVYIEQDGKVVAHTYYEDNGLAEAATVWRYLATPPIQVDEDIAQLEPDHSALETTLSGELVIRIQHADRLIAEAGLSSLTLQRTTAGSQAWFLPDSETERTARVAGLGPPSGAPRGLALSGGEVILVVAVLTLLGVLVAVTLGLLRQRRGQTRG